MSSVDPAVLDNIVAYFSGLKSWDFKKSAEHRHAGFFVRRRANLLGLAHPDWVAEADQTTLKSQIESEVAAVEAYLASKLGTRTARGPLYGGSGDPTPNHLDL